MDSHCSAFALVPKSSDVSKTGSGIGLSVEIRSTGTKSSGVVKIPI